MCTRASAVATLSCFAQASAHHSTPTLLQVKTTTSKHLGVDFDSLMASVVGMAEGDGSGDGGQASVTHEEMRRCFFGDYMDPSLEPPDRM